MHAAQLRKKLGVVEPSREERYSKRFRNADDSLNLSPGGATLAASLVHWWRLSAPSGRSCCRNSCCLLLGHEWWSRLQHEGK